MSDEYDTLEDLDELDEKPGRAKTNPSNNGPDKPHASRLVRIALAQWDTRPLPPRDWTVKNRFLRRNVSILSGEGGTGKSLIMLQLAVAQILGRDWLRSVPEKGRVTIINCEEEEKEIVRRLRPILDHYGASFAEIDRGLDIVSLAGKDAVLAYPDREGRIIPTDLFSELKSRVTDTQPVSIMLDNAADVYGGKEIERTQVRQFITLLRGLGIAANAGVLMSSHPSLTGLASKTGLSGSTAWHASVRGRAWLRTPTTKDGDEIDRDIRELEFMKNQYGPLDETLMLRWQKGLYVPEPRLGSFDELARRKETDDLFLVLLGRFNGHGRDVSHKRGTNYAPAVFAKHDDAKGTQNKDFVAAMDRLMDAKRISIEKFGPASRNQCRLIIGGGSMTPNESRSLMPG